MPKNKNISINIIATPGIRRNDKKVELLGLLEVDSNIGHS